MSTTLTNAPDLGQNDGPEAIAWLAWLSNVIVGACSDGIMPPPPNPPPPPGWWEKVVAFLIASMQGLGPIVPEAGPPDLAEHPA